MHAPPSPDEVDPSQATTRTEFGARLRAQRIAAGLSLRDLEKATRSGPLFLAKSTVENMERGKTLPKPDWLTAYLNVCGVPSGQQRAWRQARARIAKGAAAGVDTPALRLSKVDRCEPRRLGVHASIRLPVRGGSAVQARQLPELPRYVPREVDDQVREAVIEAAGRGGLLAVVGGSSTGKTRSVYEAVTAELPGWRLFHPADAGELAAAVASRQLPRGGAVVWLDEAQHYLAGSNRLTVGTMRALLAPDRPIVVVATMWPQWYEQFTTPPLSEPGTGRDLHWHARQILTTMAQVVHLDDFTPRERNRAASLAGEDPRLAIALQDPNFGPTQVLAGAPNLVERWEHATDPYAKAVMTAAIDLRRLGHLAPLPAELLCAAAPGYLSARQQATAAREWLAAAIAYATKELHGATAALVPAAGRRMGEVVGYVVADYLLQHGETIRQAVLPPGSLWDSAAAHTLDPDDRFRLADEARWRHLARYAVLLLTPLAESGDNHAILRLFYPLWEAGHREEAANWVGRALDAKDPWFTLRWLVPDLQKASRQQEAENIVRRMAEDGEPLAIYDLAMLLYGKGHDQEAEALLRRLAEDGDPDAAWELAMWLKRADRLQDAEEVLGRLIQGDDLLAMQELAEVLERRGHIQEAERWLRQAAVRGEAMAMLQLAGLLERHSRGHEAKDWLRQAAAHTRSTESGELAFWLEQHGREDELEGYLRHGAKAGNGEMMGQLASLLEQRGSVQEAEGWLRQAIELGVLGAPRRLRKMLAPSGRSQQAHEVLCRAAETGNEEAMVQVASLLEQHGSIQEAEGWLWHAVEFGRIGSEAMTKLAELLERTGRSQEADRLHRFGIEPGGRTADPW